MKKRFKMAFKPLFRFVTINRAGRGGKIENRHGFAVCVAALVMVLTLISPVWAQDHKTRLISFSSSGVKTAATSQTSAFDVSAYSEGQIFVDVTAESGTSTLDIIIQTSPDNVTWYTHTTISQITATGQTRQAITNFGNYLRIYYTVGGTSFTFSVSGVFKN
ncbi:MAG: hypothetical protein WC374_04230 [Phycisphaerae bacterium]|jgi:hypothetical protein